MPDWRAHVRRRLALPGLRPERTERIVEELAQQLDEVYRDACARGLEPAEAEEAAGRQVDDWPGLARELRAAEGPQRRSAAVCWGERKREALQDRGGARTMLADLQRDLVHALRWLVRSPGFTASAVLTLALGIGANAAVFSVVHSVLLTPPPYRQPERLVRLWEQAPARGHQRNVVNPGNYMRWAERSRSFESLGAFAAHKVNVGDEHGAQRVPFGLVSANFFDVLGVRAVLGRGLRAADGRPDGRSVVVLAHGYWQRRYGGDPGVLGRRLRVNGRLTTIAGVMPPELGLPHGAALFVPMRLDADAREARGRWMSVVGRLKPGVSLAQARAEMDVLGQALARERPDFNAGWGVSVFPLHRDLVRDVRSALLVLMGVVGCVLLIECVNLANLVTVRAAQRQPELMLRTALGAGRGRLVRQLLTESLLLAALGGGAGLLFARAGLAALLAGLPAALPAFSEVRLSLPVLGFALALVLLTGVVLGLVPAWHASQGHLHPTLRVGGSLGSGRGGRARLRAGLVVAEVALAVVLLVGAGLFLRSFHRLTTVEAGFDPGGVLTVQLAVTGGDFNSEARRTLFYRQVLQRVEALPGVRAAGAVSWLPLGEAGAGTTFLAKDKPRPAPGQEPVADVWAVEGRLLETLGIPLVRGRRLDERDGAGAPRVVLINETLARETWPRQDALGKQISMSWGEWIDAQVVGVVADARLRDFGGPARAALFWPQAQLPYGFMNVMVRAAGEPSELGPAVREQILALNPAQPVNLMRTLDAVAHESLSQPRFVAWLTTVFAALALLLALVGVYGVLSYTVSQRAHEVGVRVALGAGSPEILKMVLKQGLGLALLGVVLGTLASLGLGHLVAGLLFEVGPADLLTHLAVPVLLLAAAAAACYLPARRASNVDPLSVLRCE